MSVRYAPSPTGTLHVGNLRTAWVSHALARSRGLAWIVRFEDIDMPRVVPGAQAAQTADLAKLGLIPDKIIVQSKNIERHRTLFEAARSAGLAYPCGCSRKELLTARALNSNLAHENISSAPHNGESLSYNGWCRDPARRRPSKSEWANWRFLVEDDPTGAKDIVIGRVRAPLSDADFMPSYHWACAIDDHDGAHTLLVRASDLTHVIPLQKLIYDWVAREESSGRRYPEVFHTALLQNNDGSRLEKRTRGVTLAELEEKGVSAALLAEIFKKSFSADREPLSLTLKDLEL